MRGLGASRDVPGTMAIKEEENEGSLAKAPRAQRGGELEFQSAKI